MRVSVPPAKRNISSLVARMSRSKVDDAIDENMESWANSVFDLSLPEVNLRHLTRRFFKNVEGRICFFFLILLI